MKILLSLANEASLYDREHPAEKQLANDLPEAAALVNEGVIDDKGWAFIPYGDWPHAAGLQKFFRDQAVSIANSFNSMAERFKRAVCGLPIFKGHPDLPNPADAALYPDKEEKGQIAAVEVRNDGLAVKLVLSNAGADLVAKGWKFISPHWNVSSLGKTPAGIPLYAPTELLSVGLVSKPNIPGPSLANHAAHAANQNKTMNPKLLALLGLAADATSEQIETAITALKTKETTLANEQSALVAAAGKITALEGEKTDLTGKLTLANEATKTAQTTLANERKARIGEHVDRAIRTGRIIAADKPVWEGRLAANFDLEVVALANAAPIIKTASDIPEMLKKLDAQMRHELDNAAKKDAQKDPADDSDDDDGKDECGFGNADYAGMDHAKKGKLISKLVNDHMQKLANTPDAARYNKAFANAKSANPRLFGLKIDPEQNKDSTSQG